MIKRWGHSLTNITGSLRFKLIGWYVLLLIVSLAFFSVYIFFQFRSLQQTQQDDLLDSTADKLRSQISLNNLNDFGLGPDKHSNASASNGTVSLLDLNRENIQVHVIDSTGQVVASYGNNASLMPIVNAATTGISFVTVDTSANGDWRIYNSPLGGPQNGWIQVGQSINQLNADLKWLLLPLLVGTLIALTLAVLGGLFLANQALRPIDWVTRMAQSISTQDLAKRINYRGSFDEIGRLAQTLDLMLDRLERGFEQERRFTSDASHELRTPVTALKGKIEVTLSRERNASEYKEALIQLNENTDRLIALTNSLLFLARLDQADQPSHYEKLDLSEVLDSIMESMQAVAELKDIELRGIFAPHVQVEGNLDELTRLFLNLIGNALKYTQAGGKVNVALAKTLETKPTAIITVSDNGPGIASKHLPHLFERFYRVAVDRGTSSGGTGLGLAIAYEIARQHRGSLEIQSELGSGTTVKLQLPLVTEAK